MIHYKNPLLVLGCVPQWGDKILLCKRAIEIIKSGALEQESELTAGTP